MNENEPKGTAKNEEEFDDLTKQMMPAPKVGGTKQRSTPNFAKSKATEVVDDLKADDYVNPAATPKVRFVMYGKEGRLYLDGAEPDAEGKYLRGNIPAIQFKNRQYLTDDPIVIEQIRSSKFFGRVVWENEFPDYVLKKIELDKKFLTRDQTEHENDYAF